MKFLVLTVGIFLSLNAFASERFLKCELFENDYLVRSATQVLDENGKAAIDLGNYDAYYFGGASWGNGLMSILISGPVESRYTESSDSVISTTGSILKLTCTVE